MSSSESRCVRDAASQAGLRLLVSTAIVGSPFEKPTMWRYGVAVLRHNERRMTSRGDFGHWLASNDLHAQARECLTRRIPPGHLLVWLEDDVFTGFVVFDFATALKRRT